jgi:hypothetical protein
MKRVFVPTRSASDWQRLLAKPVLHWKQGRSAMTAAAAWEAADGHLPPEIQLLLSRSGLPELQQLTLLAAIPEWQTALPGGDRPSCTDILALATNETGLCVIAVEAKVDEDFGPTLGEKRRGASKGQSERIRYLEELLGGSRFDDSIRYQLLHRTASALLTAKQFHARTAVMLIHSFGTRQELEADFQRFCVAMSATPLPDRVHVIPGHQKPRLLLAWCAGAPEFVQTLVPPCEEFSASPTGVGSDGVK